MPHLPSPQHLLASFGFLGLLALPLAADPGMRGCFVEPRPLSNPIDEPHVHLAGPNFYPPGLVPLVPGAFYCFSLKADVLQCVVYDASGGNARLIGTEYVISERQFQGLPAAEQKQWHRHRGEGMLGQPILPGSDSAGAGEMMRELFCTYGKTWYLWRIDGQASPCLTKLMAGFSAEGRMPAKMTAAVHH